MVIVRLSLCCILAYLLGSIPFGVLIGKLRGLDPRQRGSGNIGAANSFRTFGLFWGILVLLGDLFKGVVALYIAKQLLPLSASPLYFILVGFFAIIGHNHSCYLKFKGGKGVATTAGVFFFISWKATLAAFSFWVIIVLVTRLASAASLVASFFLPVFLKVFGKSNYYVIFASLAFAMTLYKHRSNVYRLITGKENKL